MYESPFFSVLQSHLRIIVEKDYGALIVLLFQQYWYYPIANV